MSYCIDLILGKAWQGKYISDRCYNGTIMSTLFVTQYCHVHFHWGGVVVLKSTCSTPRNPLYTTKEFFLKPIYQRILRICTMALLYFYDQNPFCIFLSYLLSYIVFKFSNPSKIKSPDLYKKAKP